MKNKDSGFLCQNCAEPIMEMDILKADDLYFHKDCAKVD